MTRIIPSRDAFMEAEKRGFMRAAYGLPSHHITRERKPVSWVSILLVGAVLVLAVVGVGR